LNEGVDVCALGGFSCISVALFCGVAKEWRVPHLGGGLPMPFPPVPRKPINEIGVKNPKKGGLGE